MQGEHKSPEYRAIAPNAKVPALVLDDETIITESTAICRYLEDLYPEPSLFGSSSIEKAAIEMWQNRVVFELMLPLAMTFRHTHPAMAKMENQNASYGEQQRDVALGSLKYFDKHLAGSEYIAGDAFSFADIQVITTIQMFLPLNKIPMEDFKNISSYNELLSARPSCQV
jgi:glutathione S-transferase